MLVSGHRNAFAALAFLGLTGMTGAAVAAGPSSEFDLNGDIVTPGVYNYASLSKLPATTQTVTYKAGGTPVTDTFTGTGLWTLLGSAGGITPIPGIKNSSLLNYVVAVGSDGYQAVFSGGEINPMFGGNSLKPNMVAYADTSGPLTSSGFARTVVPGDNAGGRYVSNLVNLYVGQAPVPAKGPGGLSTQFTLSGVENPDTYKLSTLQALPAVQVTATYKAGGTPVTDTYTGVSLWTLLNDAGLITDPNIKNDVLRQYVEAIGSDGYAAIFSLGEIDPMFGGQEDLVAYADTGGQLGDGGEDGFARIVVPGDTAGGRYISNLVALKVFTAAPVPEPATWVLLIGALPALAFVRSRRRNGASGRTAH
jgi:DMSO/TMAO reductase YedYZ molybdopterin-dependent catalytic subunit